MHGSLDKNKKNAKKREGFGNPKPSLIIIHMLIMLKG